MNISEEINNLPKHLRDYIHEIESASPAELIQEVVNLRENQKALLERNKMDIDDLIDQTLKQQRNDLLEACKNGVAPFSLSQYAERFKELASKPNLAVYRVILGNAAGMFEILESEAKNREAAIAKCEV